MMDKKHLEVTFENIKKHLIDYICINYIIMEINLKFNK